jgi:hypothetical protein
MIGAAAKLGSAIQRFFVRVIHPSDTTTDQKACHCSLSTLIRIIQTARRQNCHHQETYKTEPPAENLFIQFNVKTSKTATQQEFFFIIYLRAWQEQQAEILTTQVHCLSM